MGEKELKIGDIVRVYDKCFKVAFGEGEITTISGYFLVVKKKDGNLLYTDKGCVELIEKSTKKDTNDDIEHPQRYNQGGIECFDVIEKFYGKDALEQFCLSNVLKYVMRCKLKNNYLNDLKKAKFYIDKILDINGEPQADLNQILEEIKKDNNDDDAIDSKLP